MRSCGRKLWPLQVPPAMLPAGGRAQLRIPCFRVYPYPMSHLSRRKTKLIARVRRLVGQLEAIERALEADVPCGEVLNQVASVRGAISGLTAELIEDHVQEHVLAAAGEAERAQGVSELIEAVRTYLK